MRSMNSTFAGAVRLPGALLGLLLCAGAQAQNTPLFQEVHTIAAQSTGVPIEHSIDIANAGTYQVELKDFGAGATPATPLASLKMAITSGSTIVGTPLASAGTVQFTATPGTYLLHVVGKPATDSNGRPVLGSGPIGIKVSDSTGTPLYNFSDDVGLPRRVAANSEVVLNDTFTVTSSGSYQISLADLQFPQALSFLTLGVTAQGALITTLPDSSMSMHAVVTLQAGVTYQIFALGVPTGTLGSGLYSATVAPAGGGASVKSWSVPVGGTVLLGTAPLTPASYTLTVADLGFPGALAQVGAVVVQGGQAVATLAAAGTSTPFSVANSATYQIYAVAGTAPQSAGSYATVLQSGSSPPAFSAAGAVSASDSSLSSYTFATTLTAAGDYVVDLADFQFPNALTTVKLAVVQGVQVLGSPLTAVSNAHFTGAVGPLTLLAYATAGTSSGLFGAGVTPSGTTTPIFEVTQAVGTTFTARQVSVTSAGNYLASAADVGFPANFANFVVVVTQGTGRLGQIVGGGKFPFTASAGNYFLNFIAQTAGSDNAGTYSLTFAPAGPAPVVTFAPNTTQVNSGGTVQLTWTTQNATSCVASGGWSGTQNTSGTATSSALTTDTTFTLSCSGDGGTTVKSAAITVQKSSGGGGGGLDASVLLIIALTVAARVARRYRAGTSAHAIFR
jgi:hypothetical protein